MIPSTPTLNHLRFSLLALLFISASAFITPTTLKRDCAKSHRTVQGFVLGPIARNGLAYEDIVPGQGRRILPGDTVYCYYSGSFQAGSSAKPSGPFGGFLGGGGSVTVFDAVTEGEPFNFVVGKGQVIRGMDLGVLGFEDEIPPMYVGGKRVINIPSPLAYGELEMGPIPPNTDLKFELEVLDAGNENQVGLTTRVGGYAAVTFIPLIILLVAYNVVNGNF